ncbi:MAG: hypothetical protein EA357_10545 [Micavibrio sp.]|nr:MAG: hypothetical protein EA357_10545 [Micavibrio sp.]
MTDPPDQHDGGDFCARINLDAIIAALEDHILHGTEMSATQLRAALALLKKCVPDVAAAAEAQKRKIGKEEMLEHLKTHEEALRELE